MLLRLFGGKILKDHQFLEEDLWVQDGKIISPVDHADREINLEGMLIAPGYIDLQVNGGFGVDFTKNPEESHKVAKQLPRYGVTSFIGTVITSEQASYQKILPHLQPRKEEKCAELLGIHLEGPFINPIQAGAHSLDLIKSFEGLDSLENFYGSLQGVKIISLAPELPEALKFIEGLTQQNVIVAVAHSRATFAQMQAAVRSGIKFVSHLFNSMTPFHHRSPGIIGETLLNPFLSYSLIADGAHLHPATVYMAWKCNPYGLILVTDAISGFGLPDGQYTLGKRNIIVDRGKSFIAGTDVLAGGIVGLDVAVRWLRFCTGCSAIEALEAASLKPARLLGLDSKKGTLSFGADADFVILDEALHLHATYVAGELAWGIDQD